MRSVQTFSKTSKDKGHGFIDCSPQRAGLGVPHDLGCALRYPARLTARDPKEVVEQIFETNLNSFNCRWINL
jgi:hypothetical protein